jgi:iron complex outermembrane receptor protein
MIAIKPPEEDVAELIKNALNVFMPSGIDFCAGEVLDNLRKYSQEYQDIDVISWTVNLNLRQELTEGYNVPLTPSLGLEGKIWKFIYGKVNVSRNFRIPSMNDRYWFPGGNENLDPEKSINEEVSLILISGKREKPFNADLTLTFFNALIKEWIQWIPSGQGYWSPENVMKVKSRGAEWRTKLGYNAGKFKTMLNLSYTYTKSTNHSESESVNDKQLIYVPLHKVSGQLIIETKYISLLYSQVYTGITYTLRDNSESLPGYSVADVNFSKMFKIKKIRLGLNFDILNIWNANYQAIAFRPMPGRSYRISVKLLYN